MSTNTKLADLVFAAKADDEDEQFLGEKWHKDAEQALAAHDAEQAQEPVATYMGHRLTPEGTQEFWGYSPKPLPSGTKLYAAPVEQAAQAVPAGDHGGCGHEACDCRAYCKKAAAPAPEAAQAVPAASAETPRRRIDPMQNPFRPGYYMNYQQGETPAESVLRKLACWLGAGGYNDEKLDVDLMHRKIVAAIQDLAAAPAAPAPEAAQAVPAYTEGHCKEKAKPGGCQLHNLQCGYPACDRKAAPAAPAPEAKPQCLWPSRGSCVAWRQAAPDSERLVAAPQAQAAGQEQDERAAFFRWVDSLPLDDPDRLSTTLEFIAGEKAWRAALAQRQPLTEWRPIETAPKDGRSLILLLTPSGFPQVAYSNTWWTAGFSVECKPTHWMPLPAAPGATTGEQR